MKRLLILSINALIAILFVPSLAFADTTFSSSTDLENAAISNGGVYTLTAAGSPYIFTNGIWVFKDITVNVEPGVEIVLGDGQSIIFFNGKLNANGIESNPISIRPNSSVFGMLLFGDAVNKVNADLNYVNINSGTNCTIVITGANVLISNTNYVGCSTSAISINSAADTDVVLDNVNYTKIGNPIINTMVYLSLVEGATAANPANLTIKNLKFPVGQYSLLQMLDQSNNTFDPAGIHVSINNNSFTGAVADAYPFSFDTPAKTITVDTTNNYWGNSSGPYIEDTLPKTDGPMVPSNVLFNPFLATDPSIPTVKECCSSVIFLPGIEGSRLYKKRDNGTEDQLWEANWNSDLSDMYIDTNGQSIDSVIYTKDVISKTNIVPDTVEDLNIFHDQDIYKDTLNFLQNQKDTEVIKSYTAYPYDWRLDLDNIVNNGTKMNDGSYSKLIDVLHQQAAISDTGKVTIMAHSMGGLITKRFIQSLSPADQALVDKVVMIAVPEVGTPDGTSAVLNGIKFNNGFKYASPQKYNRALAENMIPAHALSSSEKYFNVVGVSPVVLNNNLSNILPQVDIYGSEINTGEELKSFLSGIDGRPDAGFLDVNYPNISPAAVVNRAKELHDSMDNYDIPSFIKVFQIVGTGMPTVKQIEYIQKTNAENLNYVGYNIKKTFAGDGTVVKESANYLAGDTYYINLYKYNNDTGQNHEHKDISGLAPVTSIMGNIIKNEVVVQNDYMPNNPNLFDSVKLFTVGMHSPVDIHIYDAEGRHTGPVYVDLNGEVVKFIEENIPNMSYNEYGDDKYITGLDDKNYTLKLDGYDAGKFTLDVQRYTGDTATTYESFNNLPSTDLLSSTINLLPETPIVSILLDTNNDGNPDLQAGSNGKIKDLNKEDDDNCHKENNKKLKDKDKKCKEHKPDKEPKDKKDKKCKIYHEKEKNYKSNKNR